MKTILTREINGNTIIIGFSDPVIDAEETKKIIIPMLKKEKNIQNNKNKLRLKKNELMRKHAVYFTPKASEKIISEELYNMLSSVEIPKYGMLKIDGTIIYDYSKYDIWLKTSGKWNKIILSIGDVLPADAIIHTDLTEDQKIEINEQIEIDRIAELSPAEKNAEKQTIIDTLAIQAALKRSAFEIQGDIQAFEKAQEWYAEQVKNIEEKYV